MGKEWYEKAVEHFHDLPEEEKIRLVELSRQMRIMAEASWCASKLRYDKAFVQDDGCKVCGIGEYHVYMWLHADGTPFYVGSGKGDRWKNACCRNERFFEETKRLDTWVCKLVDGLTSQEAREAEFCLSHYLTYNGYKLANWDNNFHRCIDEKQADRRVGKFVRLMKSTHNNLTVELAKSKMTPRKMPCDYDIMRELYLDHYGTPA